jgi:hypothetical protein
MRPLGPAVLALLLAGPHLFAAQYRIIPEQSVFAVVTHRGGFAGGLAHNHFIVALNYEAHLRFDAEKSLTTEFDIRFAADELIVDDAELRRRWYPRLEALGILDDRFRDIPDDDRQKIRRTMLSEKQLDATAFPEISARTVDIAAKPAKKGDVELPYRVTLRLEAHGQSVEAPVAATYELVGDALRIEAVGSFHFSAFGIKPYSTMLGAVKNKDEFQVYVAIVAAAVAK